MSMTVNLGPFQSLVAYNFGSKITPASITGLIAVELWHNYTQNPHQEFDSGVLVFVADGGVIPDSWINGHLPASSNGFRRAVVQGSSSRKTATVNVICDVFADVVGKPHYPVPAFQTAGQIFLKYINIGASGNGGLGSNWMYDPSEHAIATFVQ